MEIGIAGRVLDGDDSAESSNESSELHHHRSHQDEEAINHYYQFLDERKRRLQQRPKSIALSKAESVFLAKSGDVVVCRCRNSSYPQLSNSSTYHWHEDIALLCCDNECDNLSTQLQETSLCSPWAGGGRRGGGRVGGGGFASSTSNMSGRAAAPRVSSFPSALRERDGGLLGGSPTEVVSPLHDKHVMGNGDAGLYSNSNMPRGNHEFPSPTENGNGHRTFTSRAQRAFRSPPLQGAASFDEDSIVPIRSFDYSHFFDGENDMVPSDLRSTDRMTDAENSDMDREQTENGRSDAPHFPHGVPSFLPAFSQVRITQVSAHPLGSHVLLINDAGLLYSYGLNDYGQLGIGLKTHIRGFHRGYVMTPTIVTPIIENGGKAHSCAAGVSHSLVVVVTEERRLVRSDSFDSSSAARDRRNPESIVHHQVYGFGRNDFMKIGLVKPKLGKAGSSDEMEHVVLPRRVALRCRVRPSGMSIRGISPSSGSSVSVLPPSTTTTLKQQRQRRLSQPPQGIFAIAASAEHSAALVRRASGDIELYTWGNASHGALGLPQPSRSPSSFSDRSPSSFHGIGGRGRSVDGGEVPAAAAAASTVRVVPVPSFVASLSVTSNPVARPSSLLNYENDEYPAALSLGRRCSFVTTSLGRCFSFGLSEDGMLGLGKDITETHRPSEIVLPPDKKNNRPVDEAIIRVSAGASHVVALTSRQNVYSWGTCHHAPSATVSTESTIPQRRTNTSTAIATNPSHYPAVSTVNNTESTTPSRINTSMATATNLPPLKRSASEPQQRRRPRSPLQQHQHPRTIPEGSNHGSESPIQWLPRRMETASLSSCLTSHDNSTTLKAGVVVVVEEEEDEQILEVCAGFDCTFAVTESGKVLACGKPSGRLGLGEVEQRDSVTTLEPLFGGLRLWHKQHQQLQQQRNSGRRRRRRRRLRRRHQQQPYRGQRGGRIPRAAAGAVGVEGSMNHNNNNNAVDGFRNGRSAANINSPGRNNWQESTFFEL